MDLCNLDDCEACGVTGEAWPVLQAGRMQSLCPNCCTKPKSAHPGRPDQPTGLSFSPAKENISNLAQASNTSSRHTLQRDQNTDRDISAESISRTPEDETQNPNPPPTWPAPDIRRESWSQPSFRLAKGVQRSRNPSETSAFHLSPERGQTTAHEPALRLSYTSETDCPEKEPDTFSWPTYLGSSAGPEPGTFLVHKTITGTSVFTGGLYPSATYKQQDHHGKDSQSHHSNATASDKGLSQFGTTRPEQQSRAQTPQQVAKTTDQNGRRARHNGTGRKESKHARRHPQVQPDTRSVSAWNTFSTITAQEDRAESERAQRELALRQEEEARTGVRQGPQYTFDETWKQVDVGDQVGQRKITGIAQTKGKQVEQSEPQVGQTKPTGLGSLQGAENEDIRSQIDEISSYTHSAKPFPRTAPDGSGKKRPISDSGWFDVNVFEELVAYHNANRPEHPSLQFPLVRNLALWVPIKASQAIRIADFLEDSGWLGDIYACLRFLQMSMDFYDDAWRQHRGRIQARCLAVALHILRNDPRLRQYEPNLPGICSVFQGLINAKFDDFLARLRQIGAYMLESTEASIRVSGNQLPEGQNTSPDFDKLKENERLEAWAEEKIDQLFDNISKVEEVFQAEYQELRTEFASECGRLYSYVDDDAPHILVLRDHLSAFGGRLPELLGELDFLERMRFRLPDELEFIREIQGGPGVENMSIDSMSDDGSEGDDCPDPGF